MAKLLFVEDHVELIDELVELVQLIRPKWEIVLAANILEAWDSLRVTPYDGVIIDVMLPGYPGIKQQSEGIYLAAWLLRKGKRPTDLKALPRRALPKVLFLTSRGIPGVRDEIAKLGFNAKVISRLEGDAYQHANTIIYDVEQ